MIKNLSEYFEPEYQYYLNSINYTKLDSELPISALKMDGEDRIEVQVLDKKVKLTLTRNIGFKPEGLFSLNVSFGAILTFKEDKIHEYDWNTINLADEFIHYGGFVLGNLISRITLLVGQITSSFGQPPIFLPTVPENNIDASQEG